MKLLIYFIQNSLLIIIILVIVLDHEYFILQDFDQNLNLLITIY